MAYPVSFGRPRRCSAKTTTSRRPVREADTTDVDGMQLHRLRQRNTTTTRNQQPSDVSRGETTGPRRDWRVAQTFRPGLASTPSPALGDSVRPYRACFTRISGSILTRHRVPSPRMQLEVSGSQSILPRLAYRLTGQLRRMTRRDCHVQAPARRWRYAVAITSRR